MLWVRPPRVYCRCCASYCGHQRTIISMELRHLATLKSRRKREARRRKARLKRSSSSMPSEHSARVTGPMQRSMQRLLGGRCRPNGAQRSQTREPMRANASEGPRVEPSKTTSRKRPSADKPLRETQRRIRKPRTARSPESKRSAKPKSKRQATPAHSFAVGDACPDAGIFAGKSGEIMAEEKPGYYRVKVGMLEVTVSAHDCTDELIRPLGSDKF